MQHSINMAHAWLNCVEFNKDFKPWDLVNYQAEDGVKPVKVRLTSEACALPNGSCVVSVEGNLGQVPIDRISHA